MNLLVLYFVDALERSRPLTGGWGAAAAPWNTCCIICMTGDWACIGCSGWLGIGCMGGGAGNAAAVAGICWLPIKDWNSTVASGMLIARASIIWTVLSVGICIWGGGGGAPVICGWPGWPLTTGTPFGSVNRAPGYWPPPGHISPKSAEKTNQFCCNHNQQR